MREGEKWGYGKGQLTKIFLFAISLAACRVDRAQISEPQAVVVLGTRGDVRGTLSWKAGPPSIFPLLSARSPTHCPERLGYRVVYLECSSRPPPMRVMMRERGAGALCVAESSGRGVVVRGRGGRTCRTLPTGIESVEQA